jgi:hypothetical protein
LPFALQGRGSPFALRVATLAVLLTSVFLLYGIQALGFFCPNPSTKNCLAECRVTLILVSLQSGGRSSTVEPRIVVPAVAGSSPVGHPAGIFEAIIFLAGAGKSEPASLNLNK